MRTATTSRPNTAVVIAEDIDLTSRLNLLQAGGNVLAIQGLNFTASDSDFLVRAELMENKVLGLTKGVDAAFAEQAIGFVRGDRTHTL